MDVDRIYICPSRDPETWFWDLAKEENMNEFRRLRPVGHFVTVHSEMLRSVEMYLFEHATDAKDFFDKGYHEREHAIGHGFHVVSLTLDDKEIGAKVGSAPLELITVDVLASSYQEINSIAEAMRNPSNDLLNEASLGWNERQEEISANVKILASFEPLCILDRVDDNEYRVRTFINSCERCCWKLAMRHVQLVSAQYPTAIFLVDYRDLLTSYAGKNVIRAGEQVQHLHDGDQQALGHGWAIPDIFAPYRAEFEQRREFGSMWNQWLEDMGTALDRLRSEGSKQVETETASADPAKRDIPWLNKHVVISLTEPPGERHTL